jgi:hypothetical protein
MSNSILKKILYSMGIICVWLIILFVFLYPDNNGLGKGFAVIIFLLFTLFFAIALGVVVLILRLLNFLKISSFVFVFTGVLNLCMGIYGLSLLLFHGMNETNYILLHVGSFLIGLIIMEEIFFIRKAG